MTRRFDGFFNDVSHSVPVCMYFKIRFSVIPTADVYTYFNGKSKQHQALFWVTDTIRCILRTRKKSQFLKFIYSEEAITFWEIFTLLLTTVSTVKSKVKISQNFVAFWEYMNFKSGNRQSESGNSSRAAQRNKESFSK